MSNLYTLPVNDDSFKNYCGGNLQSEHESCVEISALGTTGFALRDSKPEGAGKELRFTTVEMDDFVRGYAEQRGISL
ncbi:DUF397 domain-containing protein [Streptomyces gilvosporeus]|uniref:DUF397 domain-containing protein n=1 Tax=Streptomyces gilvosporeus TaxID=553510 RepID=A0A1V0TQ69_9ACTN|nr:DUF397 domain-containing protein [Streptomyces gilvosporeus]ARF55096.1 DUF397 domain-containing protein [Streptomyces gilvosporeus]